MSSAKRISISPIFTSNYTNMSTYRKLRVAVKADELKAFEALLIDELSPARAAEAKKKAKALYGRLVKEMSKDDGSET